MMRFGRVEISGGFFLLAAWLNYLDPAFLVPMAAVACTAHELGHFVAIYLLNGDVKLIRLTVVGAEMVLEHPFGYWQEGLCALAGPGVNLLLAFLCCEFERGLVFAGLNLALALFNLLPIGRLDGGRALYCTLALLTGQGLAARVCIWLNRLCSGSALAAGFLLAAERGNITLLLTALWLVSAQLQCEFTLWKDKFYV
ncbi:MAG: peptidase M50 [Lawsonibacter sp.]|nr:peptidase M50 [Lawsonibacter sp.]